MLEFLAASTRARVVPSDRRIPGDISIRKCGDVTVLDLRGRSITGDCASGPLTKHLRDLADQGKRKLLLNLIDLSGG
jgi:hypothetical protein